LSLANTRIFFAVVLVFVITAVFISSTLLCSYASKDELTSSQHINGVAMKGVFVNMKQHDERWPSAPQNYIENSFRMISAGGLNHVRIVFYWEAYERDPAAFIKEIQSIATAGDKYGLKIIYDNHQWHTSSWLEPRGSGFPWSLFQDSKYSKGGGGNTQDKAAQFFWKDWWNRSVKDKQGNDGWTLMAEYLKKIVLVVDNHSSTLGYEILSEPHVDKKYQWSKIGKFNSFITTELRNITSKMIVYSMNVPVDLNSQISISPKNLAKMAPSSQDNIAFKISVYAIPDGDGYQEKRFNLFLKTRDLTGIPLYIGEWNNVVRTKEGGVTKLDPDSSDLTKTDAKKILGALKKEKVWGTAFWRWDYQPVVTDNFNLVSDKSGELVPTKYFGILKDTVKKVYGSSSSTSIDFTTSAETSSIDDGQTKLINELIRTGKFTEAEAKQFVSRIIQDGVNDTSISDDTDSPNNQTNPEDYKNLNKLVDDIKNNVVDTEDISLNTFQDSAAYKGADKQTQNCIDLAGKIGDNLGDQEIVHCLEDSNYFQNRLF
jgi:polyhydroxyalkanoate synthesis regulator phasin